MLRRMVEQARALKTDLYDDLQPDASEEDAALSRSLPGLRSWKTLSIWIGVLLLVIGCVGVWQANVAITVLEHMPTGTLVPGPLSSHLLPGPIANPGKASIEAVLHPAGTKALYFVADVVERHEHHDQTAEAVDRVDPTRGRIAAGGAARWQLFDRPSRWHQRVPRQERMVQIRDVR